MLTLCLFPGNHLPFHLMDTFCKSPAFLHETLLPTCLLASTKTNLSSLFPEQTQNFVSDEDCQSIRDRLDSLRYASVRRGKQNPIKSFFTYGSMSDTSLDPWYRLPHGFDFKHIYPNGLIQKYNVVFPPWFRLVRLWISPFLHPWFRLSLVLQTIETTLETWTSVCSSFVNDQSNGTGARWSSLVIDGLCCCRRNILHGSFDITEESSSTDSHVTSAQFLSEATTETTWNMIVEFHYEKSISLCFIFIWPKMKTSWTNR